DGIEDFAVHRGHRLLHPLAAITLLVAVAQFDRLVRAGRGAGGNRGATERAVLQHDVDLDGRVAAAVEDFAADDVDDGGHWFSGRSGMLAGFYKMPATLVMPPGTKAERRMAKPPRTRLLGKPSAVPASPREAILDRVPNAHPD